MLSNVLIKHLLIFVILSFTCVNSQSDNGNYEYYSAVNDMIKILNLTKDLATDLSDYIKLEEQRLGRIRDMEKLLLIHTSLSGNKTVEQNIEPELLLGNPINAYLITKHLSSDWRFELMNLVQSKTVKQQQPIENLITNEHSLLVDSVITRVAQHTNMLPGSKDLKGVTDAILRLQTTYKLSADRLAHGKVTDAITSPNLTAAQCLHIGIQAYSVDDYVRAEEWFRTAYQRFLEELTNESIETNSSSGYQMRINEMTEVQPTIGQILDHLAYALGRQGRYSEALNVTRMLIKADSTNTRAVENELFYLDRLKHGEGIIGPAPMNKVLSTFDRENEAYEALCRGENSFPLPPDDKLTCQYIVPSTYYKIGPIKEEILFPNPRIVMFHDLIYPEEMKQIKELAVPRLRRATVRNPVSGNLEFAFYRTSKSAWIPKNMNQVTSRISDRIKFVTSLSLETAEDLQIGNYGLGGHYAPHFDFGRKREKDAFEVENGNRIATIIFYLSEVQAGGATVFNRIGARVVPKQGSAVFWYNLLPNGDGDLRTRHAACPVLVGSKWVMNLWFHERGQEFLRPCDLERGVIEDDDES